MLADALKALADPTRLKMVALMNLRDCCVCELVPVFAISQPAISKHMSRLRSSGLVKETRKGMWVFYALNRDRIAELGMTLQHLPDLTQELETLKRTGNLVQCD